MDTEEQRSSQALPAGYKLDEYVIEKEIGSGGFGITYRAQDTFLNRTVAIKEYFPFFVATRDVNLNVEPKTLVASDVDEYNWGLTRVIDEAQTLAKFEHPNIVRVMRYIERNKTAYIIMEFVEGQDLGEHLRHKGPLSLDETLGLVRPIAEGLANVHSEEMMHRDIKPDNIRIRKNGIPVLIDFGAARQAIGARSQSISTIVTPGYAPIEQYSARGNQGPWTDIYALSAVTYVCLTSEKMGHYEAGMRLRDDPLPKLTNKFSGENQSIFEAIDWGLSPFEEDRPKTIEDWLQAFENKPSPENVKFQKRIKKSEKNKHQKEKKGEGNIPRSVAHGRTEKKPRINVGLLAGVIGLSIAGVLFYMGTQIGGTEPGEISAQEPVEPDEPVELVEQNDERREAQVPPRNTVQDDSDFNIAKKVGTYEAYEIYLRLHPKGVHKDEAGRFLSRLQ